MAHGTNRFSPGPEGLDEANGLGIVDQVPERAVAARVEDGIEVARRHRLQFHALSELLRGLGVSVESLRGLGQERLPSTPWVARRLPTLGRRDGDDTARVLENEVIVVLLKVSFKDKLITSYNSIFEYSSKFSRILSKTTIVSLSEYPIIIKKAAIILISN